MSLHTMSIPLITSSTMLIDTTRITTSTLSPNYNYTDVNITKTANETEVPYIPYSKRPETYFVPIIFSFIMLIGLIGNSVLLLMLFRHRRMRNAPNTYILSLAIGDILARKVFVTKFLSGFLFHYKYVFISRYHSFSFRLLSRS